MPKDKKLNQMSSFARDFYLCPDIDKPESSNGYQVDNGGEAPRVARAKLRMEYATDSQLAVILAEQLMIGGGGAILVDEVLARRKERGDFNLYDDDDDHHHPAFLGEVSQLPSDMKDVSELTLNLDFLKSDLQFECLLFGIPYEASDSKPQLILKLINHKDTLFLHANTFQILESQCNTSTCRDDAVKSDSLGGGLLTESQMADLGEGEGGAGPSMVDAWRKKMGGFHNDDDEDEELYYDDDDGDEEEEEDDDDKQEAFLGDEVPKPTPSKFN